MLKLKNKTPREWDIVFKHKDIYTGLINSLRRSFAEIDCYTTNEENIFINKLTASNEIDSKLRINLSFMPITNINHNDLTLATKNMYIYLNIQNNTEKKYITVTSDNCKFYIDDKEVKFNYKRPWHIMRLRKNEEINLKAKLIYGNTLSKKNDCFGVCSAKMSYDEEKKEYYLGIESHGQYSCREIYIKGCSILIRKLDGLVNQIEKVTIKEAFTEKSKSMIDDVEEKKIKKKEESKEYYIDFYMENEDHTLGNLTKECLEQSKDISFVGYKKIHLLSDKIYIIIRSKKKDIKKIIESEVNKTIKLLQSFIKEIEKI